MAVERPTNIDYSSRFQEIFQNDPDNQIGKEASKIKNPSLDRLTLEVVQSASRMKVYLNEDKLFEAFGIVHKDTYNQNEWDQFYKNSQAQRLVQISVFNLLLEGKLAVAADDSTLLYRAKPSTDGSAVLDVKRLYRYIAKHELTRVDSLAIDDQRVDHLVMYVLQNAGTKSVSLDSVFSRLGANRRLDIRVRQAFESLMDANIIYKRNNSLMIQPVIK